MQMAPIVLSSEILVWLQLSLNHCPYCVVPRRIVHLKCCWKLGEKLRSVYLFAVFLHTVFTIFTVFIIRITSKKHELRQDICPVCPETIKIFTKSNFSKLHNFWPVLHFLRCLLWLDYYFMGYLQSFNQVNVHDICACCLIPR